MNWKKNSFTFGISFIDLTSGNITLQKGFDKNSIAVTRQPSEYEVLIYRLVLDIKFRLFYL